MNRRKFLAFMPKLSAVVAFTPRLLAAASADAPFEIAKLYRNAIVIDSLAAPFTDLEKLPSAETVAAVRDSGITAVNWTVSQASFEETINSLATVDELCDELPDDFTIVRQYSDIARAKRNHKIGILMGFQNTQFLEDDPARIEVFRKLGVRIMQITYNNRSVFGDGCLEPGNAGLSKAGVAAIHKMNEVRVAIDLSHSGYRTTSEGIAVSAKPVLITHSGCAAVYSHPRNKPDEILKSLADRGGYFGV